MTRHHIHIAWLVIALGCNSPGSSSAVPGTKGAAEPTIEGRPALPADPREADLAKGIGELLTRQHLLGRELDDEVSRKAFTEYMKRIDPGKTFLLKSHLRELEIYRDRMDDQILKGDLTLARVGAALMADRQVVVAKIVADRLQDPFDFSLDEEMETDPDKLSLVATEEELADRWRKVLKRQVLQRVQRMNDLAESLTKALNKPEKDTTPEAIELAKKALAKIPNTPMARQKKARADLARSFAGRFSRLAKLEPLEPVETFLNSIASVFDPHTLYLAPAEKENFDIQMSGSLEGIGAVLSEDDHYILVREIVPGGASSRQGKLKAGDLIMAVAQDGKEPVEIADMRINQVVQMIRGPKGTIVTLTVKKPDDQVVEISITRDVVAIEASYARGAVIDLGPKHQTMGLIYLPSFYGNTRSRRGMTPQRTATDDVRALLEEFSRRRVSGVIIDLRGNGGGLLNQARDIAGMFIKTGPVVTTRYSNGESEVFTDKDASVSFSGEVIVLVDRFSASASEIVAGALQDYSRGLIAGTATHGKGTVQVLLDLDRMTKNHGKPLGVLKLTIQQFFRINGESTQWRGVVPDVELPDPAAHIESRERYLDNAIPWSKIEPLEFTRSTHRWSAAALALNSKRRVSSQAVFDKIAKQSAYIKKRRETTTVSLNRKKWLEQRAKDKTALDELDAKLDEGDPRFDVKIVTVGTKGKPKIKNERIERWSKTLARDPWVEEALYLLTDMVKAR